MAELVLSLCDLLEAEGRSLRTSVKRTGAGCVLITLGLLFCGAGLAFITAAIYEGLCGVVSRPIAMLILAGVCIIFAVGILWSAKLCSGKPKKKNSHKS